jgi:hypothetical protein
MLFSRAILRFNPLPGAWFDEINAIEAIGASRFKIHREERCARDASKVLPHYAHCVRLWKGLEYF